MSRFTHHSQVRFIERRPDLFPDGSPLPSLGDIKSLMSDSYRGSTQISRAEAGERVHLPHHRYGDYFYRAERGGSGIWVGILRHTGCELVITYIIPGGTDTQAEIDAAIDAYSQSA